VSEKRETRGERQQRLARDAQAAHDRGEWDPAPPGAGAAADRDAAYKRTEWGQAVDTVQSARERARFEREMLETFATSGASPEMLRECRRDIDKAEAEVAEAEAELARLREKRKPN
jgi:hypothetical protein